MASIKFEGVQDLQKKLKKNVQMDDIKKVVKHHGAELQQGIQDNADFRGHYENDVFVPATGATKRSVTLEIKDGGMEADAGPTTEYSPYLEYGTRFMDAQPFIKPAFDKQKKKFKKDLDKLME